MSDPVISTDPNKAGNANLIYILYLVACVVGVTAIIGVVMAYMAKDDAPQTGCGPIITTRSTSSGKGCFIWRSA